MQAKYTIQISGTLIAMTIEFCSLISMATDAALELFKKDDTRVLCEFLFTDCVTKKINFISLTCVFK
jgi:hypothetical protein